MACINFIIFFTKSLFLWAALPSHFAAEPLSHFLKILLTVLTFQIL